MTSKFNKGEIAVQELVGQRLMAERVGRSIQPKIALGAFRFMEQQKMTVVGSIDQSGQIWASLILGVNGVIEVPNMNGVILHKSAIRSTQDDIFFKNIQQNKAVGALFIELATRRRYRVNGKAEQDNHQIRINTEEAYGNCPKYIQRGLLTIPEKPATLTPSTTTGSTLGEVEKTWISNADTFFLATSSVNGKMDASHRGGNKGFVQVLEDGTLKIPDYAGNNMYNSLGNIYENPNTGLLFVDFEKGATLQLTGTAELQFNQTETEDLALSGDTGRFWLFKTKAWIRTDNHHQVDWEFWDASPFNP